MSETEHGNQTVQPDRVERLAALIESYGESPDNYDEGVEEDVRPYLCGEQPCGRFVCVTAHGERRYFLPCYDNLESAQARAIEYVIDSLFTETPVAVHDLDEGSLYSPDWRSLQWTGIAAP
jgi:hypothetical protein